MRPDFGPEVHWRVYDEQRDFYQFQVAILEQVITIRLYQTPNGWEARRSHAIHTPIQDHTYWGSRTYNSRQHALRMEVTAISSYYRRAVEEGYTPREDWLEPKFEGINGDAA
jgi:hypothetical protein